MFFDDYAIFSPCRVLTSPSKERSSFGTGWRVKNDVGVRQAYRTTSINTTAGVKILRDILMKIRLYLSQIDDANRGYLTSATLYCYSGDITVSPLRLLISQGQIKPAGGNGERLVTCIETRGRNN